MITAKPQSIGIKYSKCYNDSWWIMVGCQCALCGEEI